MTVTLEQYQQHYGFETVVPWSNLEEELARLTEWEQQERFKPRLRFYRWRLEWLRNLNALAPDIIDLGIDKESFGYFIVPKGLYIGGVKRSIRYYRHRHDLRGYYSLYIGEMPTWVADKYQQAEPLFGKKDLFVASKDKRLFSQEVIHVPQVSPLLIGYKDGLCYLLAAWGLEHELPQSLGGLLPDD